VLPRELVLHQNAPNPFNPTTIIRYDVPAGRNTVSLKIYDVSGQFIRTLVDGKVPPGKRSETWDGRDLHGNAVSSGIYFYKLETGPKVLTRKMVLLK